MIFYNDDNIIILKICFKKGGNWNKKFTNKNYQVDSDGTKVCFFKKIQDWIFKSERIRKLKWILRSLLNGSIQDLSDHVGSKEPKNPLPEWILLFL